MSPEVDEQLLCTEPFCLWVQPQVCVTEKRTGRVRGNRVGELAQ